MADVLNEAGPMHGGFIVPLKQGKLAATSLESASDELLASVEKRFERSEPDAALADSYPRYWFKKATRAPASGMSSGHACDRSGIQTNNIKVKDGEVVNRVITELAKGMSGTKQEKTREGRLRTCNAHRVQ